MNIPPVLTINGVIESIDVGSVNPGFSHTIEVNDPDGHIVDAVFSLVSAQFEPTGPQVNGAFLDNATAMMITPVLDVLTQTISQSSGVNACHPSPFSLIDRCLSVLAELTVTDDDGASTSAQFTVNYSQAPQTGSSFSLDAGEDVTSRVDIPVDLTATAIGIDATLVNIDWQQTAGTPVIFDTAANPTRINGDASLIDEVLEFTATANGTLISDSVQVQFLANQPPQINLLSDAFIGQGDELVLNAQAVDIDGAITLFSWSQVSGPAVELDDVNSESIRFAAPSCNIPVVDVLGFLFNNAFAQDFGADNVCETLEFLLMVIDDSGASTTTIVTVNILENDNIDPVVTINDPGLLVVEQQDLSLVASASDADNDVLSYSWLQLQGPRVAMSSRISPTMSFKTPSVTGNTNLVFQVTVNDGRGGTVSEEITILVRESSPLRVISPVNGAIFEKGDSMTVYGRYEGPISEALSIMVDMGLNTVQANINALTGEWVAEDVFFDTTLNQQFYALTVVSDDGGLSSQTINQTINYGNIWHPDRSIFTSRGFGLGFIVDSNQIFAYVVDEVNGEISKVDLASGRRSLLASGGFRSVVSASNNRLFASSTTQGIVELDVGDGSILRTIDAAQSVTDMAVSEDATTLVVIATSPNRIIQYNINDSRLLASIGVGASRYRNIAYNESANEVYVTSGASVLATGDAGIDRYDLSNGEVTHIRFSEFEAQITIDGVVRGIFENRSLVDGSTFDFVSEQNTLYLTKAEAGRGPLNSREIVALDFNTMSQTATVIYDRAQVVDESIPHAGPVFFHVESQAPYMMPFLNSSIAQIASGSLQSTVLTQGSRGFNLLGQGFSASYPFSGMGYDRIAEQLLISAERTTFIDLQSGDIAHAGSNDGLRNCADNDVFRLGNSVLFQASIYFDSQTGDCVSIRRSSSRDSSGSVIVYKPVDQAAQQFSIADVRAQFNLPTFSNVELTMDTANGIVFVYDIATQVLWRFELATENWSQIADYSTSIELGTLLYDAASGDILSLADGVLYRLNLDSGGELQQIRAFDNAEIMASGRTDLGELLLAAGDRLYTFNLNTPAIAPVLVSGNGVGEGGDELNIIAVQLSASGESSYVISDGVQNVTRIIEIDHRTGNRTVIYN